MVRSLLIKPMMNEQYPTVTHGDGIYLFDKTGKKYMDGCSGAVTASIGHANKEIIEAMHDQAKKVSFVYRSQFTSEPAEQLAIKLNELIGGASDYWSFFVNSGSEAIETALKIAIQHWQEQGNYRKNIILSRRISYHGITIGALSLSGHVKRRERFVPLLEDWPLVAPPYCYRCPFRQKHPDCQLFCANDLETVIERIGDNQVAAFIAEPIVGAAGGVIVPPPGYYERIREICDRFNILFIADEVMTGLGRTGEILGLDHWGVKADIIALGKGLSAGYTPIAAALASEKVMEPILNGSNSIMSGHTLSANPQSAAVAFAVVHFIEKNRLIEKVRENGAYLMQKLQALAAKNSTIGDVRGKGLMIGLEFVADKKTKQPFPPEASITKKIVDIARDKGLLVYPAQAGKEGVQGDAIIIAPPFIITKQEIDVLVDLLEETIGLIS
ncbi:aspartate aminotransferase family protein [Calidifontibacillus erzurumensis]|uniref:Aspartate aminotransferase family protein n=1 Tax=Calidifontibacillus erzurumensis TaxID=2741433 RepID=A0A8J8KBX5_9BACI|nr:aspartate aminotransferase family protein [Calidifontibacillus erzurumensis]NSL52419.1 aspartate aminotransferase family protein [Calidifontibacillus erzurumensis]